MNIVIWIIIFLFFLISAAGVFVPLVPDTIPLWGAFLISRLLDSPPQLSGTFWLGMVLLSIFILLSDYVVSSVFANRYGASRLSVVGVIAGLLIGPLLMGPVGIILGPFLCVLAVGLIQNRENQDQIFKQAAASVIGVFSSSVIKLLLQLIMFIWFLSYMF